MRDGTALPKRIANAPTLHLGLELYYNAFWELSTCRSTGWGLGPIPWLAMREYALVYELTEDQEEDLYYFIREMDNAYVAYHNKDKPGKGKKPSRSVKRSPSSHGAWGSGARRSRNK